MIKWLRKKLLIVVTAVPAAFWFTLEWRAFHKGQPSPTMAFAQEKFAWLGLHSAHPIDKGKEIGSAAVSKAAANAPTVASNVSSRANGTWVLAAVLLLVIAVLVGIIVHVSNQSTSSAKQLKKIGKSVK